MFDPKPSPQEIFNKREEFGLENSVKLLTDIVETEKDYGKRTGAVKYLGLVSREVPSLKKECFSTLENVLISEDGIEIKCEAAKALGKLGFEKALKPLMWILEQKLDNIDVKLSVLKAIKKIKFEEPQINLFINELDSHYNSIKDFVKNQLLSIEPEILIKALLSFLKSENISNEHKSEIIKLIGYELSSINVSFEDISYLKVKYPEVISNLIQNKQLILNEITRILKELDPELMDSAVSILKLLGSDINQDVIRLLLSDDFIVKKNAIALTGKLKLIDAVDFLTQNLDNMYNEVSIATIEALGEIGDLSAVPEMLGILDIEDISFEYTDLDMKLYIIDAIKKIYLSNKNVNYDSLFSYLNSDNDTIKESIAFILGEIGNEEFVKPLRSLLKIRNLDVKKNTIIALGKIGNIEPIGDLIEVLENSESYWLIKKVAVDAIYNIFQRNWYKVKDDDAELKRTLNKDVAIIIDYLKRSDDENFKVKVGLIKFLEMFGEEHALSALLSRVNDFPRIVRIHASNAIKKIEEKLELENAE